MKFNTSEIEFPMAGSLINKLGKRLCFSDLRQYMRVATGYNNCLEKTENRVFIITKISSNSLLMCSDAGYISTYKERIDGADERDFIYEVPDDAAVICEIKKTQDKSGDESYQQILQMDNFYKNCLQFAPGTGTFISEHSLALCFEKFTGKGVITFSWQIFILLTYPDFKANYSFNGNDGIDCFCKGENWGVFNFKFTKKAIELMEANK